MTGALDRLRAELAARELPAILVSDISSIGWLTRFTGSYGTAVVTGTDAVFISDSRYTIQASEQVPEMKVATFSSPTDAADFLGEQVRALGLTEIGFESDSVTHATYARWTQKLAGISLVPVEGLIASLRMVKTPEEIAKIRRACELADACFSHVQRMIQPGVSEWDIGLDIEFFFRRHGADIAFAPVVVSGERSARPHGRATEKKLEKGDFLTLDFGASVDGYNSDITRTVVVGEASERHAEIYGQVLKAQMACLEAMRPGVPAREVDALARRVLNEAGLAKYFGHGLGHGLGRLVHDAGRMNGTSEHVLEPGQVWTVEPGVYIEGFGGVRIEDDVAVTAEGIELLTHSPKQMMVLP